jgi:hypothetical protein
VIGLFESVRAIRPALLSAWLETRDLPPAPVRSFREEWRRRVHQQAEP